MTSEKMRWVHDCYGTQTVAGLVFRKTDAQSRSLGHWFYACPHCAKPNPYYVKATPPASHDAGEAVTTDDASTPAWTSQSGRRIATLTAEVSRLTGELERSRKECEGLREAALATAGMYGRDCRESMLRAFEQAAALSAGEKT